MDHNVGCALALIQIGGIIYYQSHGKKMEIVARELQS